MNRSILPEGVDANSLSDEEFTHHLKEYNKKWMQKGIDLGWWETFDKIGPIPFSQIFKISDFGPKSTMAHVMFEAKLFGSVSEARRSGWNKPIVSGKWIVGKNRNVVIIEEG